jgi:hypothetical protein
MLYCIDTQTFIWAVKNQAEPHDLIRLEEARNLIQWLDEFEHGVVVPAIVLAEALIREPIEKHQLILAQAHNRFVVADFDSRCAAKYGELLRLENWTAAKDLARENSIRREKMKLDHMIISCAIVNGVSGIFSNDKDVHSFASGIVPVHYVHAIPR